MAKQSSGKTTRQAGEDFTLEKSLPSNIEAERMILGAILLDNATINQAVERLKPDDFFLTSHRRIYEKMINLYEHGRGIDPITLQEDLRRAGELDVIGGPAYIASLFDGVPRFSNIDNYTKIVKGKATLRRLITSSNQIMAMAFDGEGEPEEILDEAERMILSIAEDRIKQGFVHIGEVAGKQLEVIEEIAGREQLITGIATGFHDIDYMTSGLQRGDLIIIAARPSMGKTALGLCVAQNAALRSQHHGQKAVVGIFSLEMSKEQLVQRLLCSQARVDAHRLRSGMLQKDDWRRLAMAVGELSEAQIFLDDTPGISVLEMRAKARRLKNEQKALDLLIVDYMQLMSGRGRYESRQQEVSQISRELKMLAKELNVPLVALSQLSRAPETRTGSHKPQLSDLRESGCLSGDTLITLADEGSSAPIRDLVGHSGFKVWALNEETLKIEKATVSRAFATGVKPVYRLTTRLGRCVHATANHRFRAFEGWKRLDQLNIGDRVALPRSIGCAESQTMSAADFLRHLWATDGCILFGKNAVNNYPAIYYASSSEFLARDVQSLLLRLGINACLRRIPQKGKGRDQYHVSVTGKADVERFVNDIGAVGNYKNEHLDAIKAYLATKQANTNRDIIPYPIWRKYVVPAMQLHGMSTRQMMAGIHTAYCGTGIYKQNVSRERAARIAAVVESIELTRLAQSDIYWDEIVSIEPDGVADVFDLTVEKHHNFIASDIVVHNSIEQDADVVMFIYREEVYKPETEKQNIAEIIIGKQRNGPVGSVELVFLKQLTRFEDKFREG